MREYLDQSGEESRPAMTLHPDEQARELLNVPGFTLHWIPEHYEAALKHATALLARVRLAEAEWWADPERQNGPKTLYPNEQDHIDELKRQAAGEEKR